MLKGHHFQMGNSAYCSNEMATKMEESFRFLSVWEFEVILPRHLKSSMPSSLSGAAGVALGGGGGGGATVVGWTSIGTGAGALVTAGVSCAGLTTSGDWSSIVTFMTLTWYSLFLMCTTTRDEVVSHQRMSHGCANPWSPSRSTVPMYLPLVENICTHELLISQTNRWPWPSDVIPQTLMSMDIPVSFPFTVHPAWWPLWVLKATSPLFARVIINSSFSAWLTQHMSQMRAWWVYVTSVPVNGVGGATKQFNQRTMRGVWDWSSYSRTVSDDEVFMCPGWWGATEWLHMVRFRSSTLWKSIFILVLKKKKIKEWRISLRWLVSIYFTSRVLNLTSHKIIYFTPLFSFFENS